MQELLIVVIYKSVSRIVSPVHLRHGVDINGVDINGVDINGVDINGKNLAQRDRGLIPKIRHPN